MLEKMIHINLQHSKNNLIKSIALQMNQLQCSSGFLHTWDSIAPHFPGQFDECGHWLWCGGRRAGCLTTWQRPKASRDPACGWTKLFSACRLLKVFTPRRRTSCSWLNCTYRQVQKPDSAKEVRENELQQILLCRAPCGRYMSVSKKGNEKFTMKNCPGKFHTPFLYSCFLFPSVRCVYIALSFSSICCWLARESISPQSD